MGQITIPAAPGITVLPVDRQTGPSAGPGNTGNDVIFLGAGAGTNNTGNNSIAIGNSALSGGNQNSGNIAIGVNASKLVVAPYPGYGPDTVIGTGANESAQVSGQNIIIGTNALYQNPAKSVGALSLNNVILGYEALQNFGVNYPNNGGVTSSVAIGFQVMGGVGPGGSTTITGSIILGALALSNITNGINGTVGQSTVIGDSALLGVTAGTVSGSVLIGDHILNYSPGTQNAGIFDSTGVGAGIYCTANVSPRYAVAFGNSARMNDFSTTIGWQAGIQGASPSNDMPANSVYIGSSAGNSGANPANAFLLEVSDDGQTTNFTYTLMYGRFDRGNLIIGNMPYTDRDLETIGATNALKLTNGTRGAGNPTGGGFFYVSAGALHWVGTSGTDTTLAPA